MEKVRVPFGSNPGVLSQLLKVREIPVALQSSMACVPMKEMPDGSHGGVLPSFQPQARGSSDRHVHAVGKRAPARPDDRVTCRAVPGLHWRAAAHRRQCFSTTRAADFRPLLVFLLAKFTGYQVLLLLGLVSPSEGKSDFTEKRQF